MQRLMFVFNPHSGKEMIKGSLCDILDIFTKQGYDVTVHPTQENMDAYEYIKSNVRGYDRLVVSGGDGTLNEACGALMTLPKEERPCVGYIPAGSTNDFAATLGLSKDIKAAAETAVMGKPFLCDIGRFNGSAYFNYVAGFGAFTDVSYDTPQRAKNMLGHLAYVIEGMKRLPSLKSYKIGVQYDGGSVCGEFFLGLVTNSAYVGGITHDSYSGMELDDGMFEAVLFKMPANVYEWQKLLANFVQGATESDMYYVLKTKSINFESEEKLKWTLDGEFGGEYSTADIEVEPKSVAYIV